MRWGAVIIVCGLLAGCSATGLVDDTIPEAIRRGASTFGEEGVRDDIDTFATSPQIQHVLTQLTRALLDTAAGAAREQAVTDGLRELLRVMIQEMRADLGDIPPELLATMDTQLDTLMRRAEAMIGRVMGRAMHDVRAMIHGQDISDWARDTLVEVLRGIVGLASEELGDDSAHRVGVWMHDVFRELMVDVDLEEGTRRMARAAAEGFGEGLAHELAPDAGLGQALHQQSSDIAQSLHAAITDASYPWIGAAGLLAIAAIAMLILYIRTHRAHQTTIEALQHAANHGTGDPAAKAVLRSIRERGVKLGEAYDGLGPPPPPKS